MRRLDTNEIQILERNRCFCEDWTKILVSDDFNAIHIRNSNFYGYVMIGKGVKISDTRMIKGSGKPAKPNIISVLNEGGDGNVILCHQLTAQLAWLMMKSKCVMDMVRREVESDLEKLGNRQWTVIGDYTVIEGASRIEDSEIGDWRLEIGDVELEMGKRDAAVYIGNDVVVHQSVIVGGAELTDGAKVYESFVGEAVHIGKGFSSEASLFFANAYMDNGESCAAVLGPFACSHHKSTLLIGGEFSFYNAGSNTNQSNHAYKMGPIHWGTLQRGAKTASGCHILWPATIGMFSMVMGKLTQHPNLENLPFSYVFANPEKTYIYPGINMATVGTWRDINKWPKRDARAKSSRRDIITFDFPNPLVKQYAEKGIETLRQLAQEQGDNADEYRYQSCFIKNRALHRGLEYYELLLSICDKSWEGEYVDVLGCIISKEDKDEIVRDVAAGKICDSETLISRINEVQVSGSRVQDSEAMTKWKEMIADDARKEFAMGDVEESQLDDFLELLNS